MRLTWDFKHPHSFTSANSTDKLRQGGRGFGGEESSLHSRPKGEKFARRLNSHLRNQEFGTSLAAAAGRAARVQSLGFQLASESASVSSSCQVPSALGRKQSNSAHEVEHKSPGKENVPVPKTALALPGQPVKASTPGGPGRGREGTPGAGGRGRGRSTAFNSQQESNPALSSSSQVEVTQGCPVPAGVRFAITALARQPASWLVSDSNLTLRV